MAFLKNSSSSSSSAAGGGVGDDLAPVGVMYGPWIQEDVPVQVVKRLDEETKVYIIKHKQYTKMVSTSGNCKYYEGEVSDFRPEDWPAYKEAADMSISSKVFLLKGVPAELPGLISDFPGQTIRLIAMNYKKALAGISARDGEEVKLSSRDRMLDQVVLCMKVKCFPELDAQLFQCLRNSAVYMWSYLLPNSSSSTSRSKLRLQDARKAAVQADFIDVKDIKERYDYRLILLEATMIALRYVSDFNDTHEDRIVLFDNYDEVKTFYSKVERYTDDMNLSYKKGRFPEDKVDDFEQELLKSFANFVRATVKFLEVKDNKKKLVMTLVTRIVEGVENKYKEGSGMTASTRRRVTIIEDETNVMPKQRKIRSTDLVQIVSNPSALTEDTFKELVAPCELEWGEINDFDWEPCRGLVVKSTEVSSNYGNIVATMSSVYKDHPTEELLYSKTINITALVEGIHGLKIRNHNNSSLNADWMAGAFASSSHVSSNSSCSPSFISSASSEDTYNTVLSDCHLSLEEYTSDLNDILSEILLLDNESDPLERAQSYQEMGGGVTLEKKRYSDGTVLVRSASIQKRYNNGVVSLSTEQMHHEKIVSKILHHSVVQSAAMESSSGFPGGFTGREIQSLNRLYSAQSTRSNQQKLSRTSSLDSSTLGLLFGLDSLVGSPRSDSGGSQGSESRSPRIQVRGPIDMDAIGSRAKDNHDNSNSSISSCSMNSSSSSSNKRTSADVGTIQGSQETNENSKKSKVEDKI